EVRVAGAVPVRVERDGVPGARPDRAAHEVGEPGDGRDVVLQHEVVRGTRCDGGPRALRGAQRAGRAVRVGVLDDPHVERRARPDEGRDVTARGVVHDDDAQHRLARVRAGRAAARHAGPRGRLRAVVGRDRRAGGGHGATSATGSPAVTRAPAARRRTRRTASGSMTASPTTFVTAIVVYSATGPPPVRASIPPTPSETAW